MEDQTNLTSLQKELNTALDHANNGQSMLDLWLFSLELAIFGLLAMFIIAFLIYKGKDPWNCIRGIGTITIIVIAGLLIIGGYQPEQISSVIGLLGTIAGYLLGKSSSNPR